MSESTVSPTSVPIPPGSVLATGWRAVIVNQLQRRGLHEVMDVLSAYAELRCRAERDDCSAAEESMQGGWLRVAAPPQRSIEGKSPKPHPGTIRPYVEPRRPGRPRTD